jgi:hypothetical protein
LTLQELLGSSIPVIVLAWIAGRPLRWLPKALLARFLGWPAGSSVIAIEIPYGSAGPAVLTGPDPFVVDQAAAGLFGHEEQRPAALVADEVGDEARQGIRRCEFPMISPRATLRRSCASGPLEERNRSVA